MIVVKDIDDLRKYKELIESFKLTNYQQTYNNIYSVHLSNSSAKTYISDNMISTFIDRNENIIECALNIDPIININQNVLKYIDDIQKITKKNIYFPLVYDDSKFYMLLNKKIYNYKRLYTSLANFKNEPYVKIQDDNASYFSRRKEKIIKRDMYIKYYTNIDVKEIIKKIEIDSWKYEAKQDMINKKEQLEYYNELIKNGIARIAVAYTKNDNELVAYRIDAFYNNKVHILKNSYREQFKKYSIGTYLLVCDLYKNYKNCKYIDLYGGPGLSKKLIEKKRINRYDMIYGTGEAILDLENNRKSWDRKNYNVFLNGKSLKEVFNKKENILVATSCFGLGPVGKLNAIIESAGNRYNWYAAGEEFDIGIFNKNIFNDCCFTLEQEKLKQFVDKYNIKYAIVVLKNKMARMLKDIGVRVIYVDSLPFMWTKQDAHEGKIPYNVDVYCAQKTLDLTNKSKKLFSKVENLVWINPIINNNVIDENKYSKYILLNVGGLHSPNTNGVDYIDAVIVPIIEKYSNKKILITTSTNSSLLLKKYLKKYKNVIVTNLKQEQFFNYLNKNEIFITSPGLTTILESCISRNNVIFLPPQNISQFYNVEYGKKVFKKYKEISWNDNSLTLKSLSKINDKNEHQIVMEINKKIYDIKLNKKYADYVNNMMDSDYVINKHYIQVDSNGAEQVIDELRKLIERGN